MRVRLHIERLVVEGIALDPGGGRRLEAAVTRELSRLLGQGKLNPALLSGGAIPQLQGPGLQLDAGRNPIRIGTQLARAIYAGLKDPGTP